MPGRTCRSRSAEGEKAEHSGSKMVEGCPCVGTTTRAANHKEVIKTEMIGETEEVSTEAVRCPLGVWVRLSIPAATLPGLP